MIDQEVKRLIVKVAAIAIATVIVIVIVAGWFVRSSQKKAERRIEAIEKRRDKILIVDSVFSASESRILDSLKLKVDRQDAEIAELNKQLQKTQRSHDKLQKRVNDINVFMPDF